MSLHRIPALALAALLAASGLARADDPVRLPLAEIDPARLAEDTRRDDIGREGLALAWWIPSPLWEAALTRAGVDERTAGLLIPLRSRYTIVAVVKGGVDDAGTLTFLNEADTRAVTWVLDRDGTRLAPIAETRLAGEIRVLFSAIRPELANAIGPAGRYLHFFAFPATDATGRALADPYADGELSVALGDSRLRFRTPLPSLLRPMRDAASGEAFPGTFRFNPYTGAHLRPASPTPPAASE